MRNDIWYRMAKEYNGKNKGGNNQPIPTDRYYILELGEPDN